MSDSIIYSVPNLRKVPQLGSAASLDEKSSKRRSSPFSKEARARMPSNCVKETNYTKRNLKKRAIFSLERWKRFFGNNFLRLLFYCIFIILGWTTFVHFTESRSSDIQNAEIHFTNTQSAKVSEQTTTPSPVAIGKNKPMIRRIQTKNNGRPGVHKRSRRIEQFTASSAVMLADEGWNNVIRIDLRKWFVTEEAPTRMNRTLPHREIEGDSKDGAPHTFESLCDASAPSYDWQDSFFLSCNNIHEIDMDVTQRRKGANALSQHINNGYIRDVWEVVLSDNSLLALKSLRYHKSFSHHTYDEQRIDAVISERLTSSRTVANIYGYCAFTALYDFSSEGTLETNYPNTPKKDRLHIAARISRGLADVHALGGGEHSAIIHGDISPRQYVMVNGEYYFNDFNTARLLRWDKLKKRPCPGFYRDYFTDCNRTPEENKNIGRNAVNEKIDVYSLGNIFQTLLMNGWWADAMSDEECMEQIRFDKRPLVFPDNIAKSDDPVDIALIHAIKRSIVHNADERATALEIAVYLEDALAKASEHSIK